MPSLSNIPEPTTGYRPDDLAPAPQAAAPTRDAQVATAQQSDTATKQQADQDEPQKQIDSVSCLLMLLIAGGLLRAVLGILGPLQGLIPGSFEQLAQQGHRAFTNDPTSALPIPGLLAAGLSIAGIAGWVMVALGSLLTLAATPAAYVIGRATTGRRSAGILAAALVTVHPGVLAASNTLSGTALALGLLTIGLALSLHGAKRGLPFAIAGGLTLALAGLAAPLCWVAAAFAGPFVGHLARDRGRARAFAYGITVFVLALSPVVAYRAVYFGTSADALFVEFSGTDHVGRELRPADRLLVTLTDPSLAELGEALHLPVGESGQLSANTISRQPNSDAKPDFVADFLADAWLVMNTALGCLAIISIGILLLRRRFIETALLTTPLLALAFANVTPGEMLKLPMIALLGVLAAGLLASRPVRVIDEEERAAKRIAKLAAKEDKRLAKAQRQAEKHKEELFAFDTPKKRKKKAKPEMKNESPDSPQPEEILTARIADEPSTSARPI